MGGRRTIAQTSAVAAEIHWSRSTSSLADTMKTGVVGSIRKSASFESGASLWKPVALCVLSVN